MRLVYHPVSFILIVLTCSALLLFPISIMEDEDRASAGLPLQPLKAFDMAYYRNKVFICMQYSLAVNIHIYIYSLVDNVNVVARSCFVDMQSLYLLSCGSQVTFSVSSFSLPHVFLPLPCPISSLPNSPLSLSLLAPLRSKPSFIVLTIRSSKATSLLSVSLPACCRSIRRESTVAIIARQWIK